MKYLPILWLLSLTGCLATSADLRDVADTIDAMESGYFTRDEAVREIDDKAAELEARTIRIPTSPADALVTILGVGGAAIGTAAGAKRWTNGERDGRRRQGTDVKPGA